MELQPLITLGKKKVGGIFFEIGGHSLLVIQIIADLKTFLGVDISIRDFFENPDVAALALIVQEELGRTDEDDEQELARLLALVENMSDEEVRDLLDENRLPG